MLPDDFLAGGDLSALWVFCSPRSSLKHQLEVTRRRLFQLCAALGLGSTSVLKGTSIAAKIGLFYYYCFNMAFYGGQMSWLAAFCPGSLYPTIIFWCEIHFTPYESTGHCCNASASVSFRRLGKASVGGEGGCTAATSWPEKIKRDLLFRRCGQTRSGLAPLPGSGKSCSPPCCHYHTLGASGSAQTQCRCSGWSFCWCRTVPALCRKYKS